MGPFARMITLVDLQRELHMVFAATGGASYCSLSTNDALAFLGAPKLPSALARYVQIGELVFNVFAHFSTSRFGSGGPSDSCAFSPPL